MVRLARQGRVSRSWSLTRGVAARRKRNLSLLVGKESEEAQEQIVSHTIQTIIERKGEKRFWLRLMEGGGSKGIGEEICIGETKEEATILPLQVFQEVKKSLVLSKQKMTELCSILWKNRVHIESRIREKLAEIDNLLDSDYKTVQVTFI